MFKAILIERDAQPYRANLKNLDDAQLPAGEVTVRVDNSTLNAAWPAAWTFRHRSPHSSCATAPARTTYRGNRLIAVH
jgi:hypothetical protein